MKSRDIFHRKIKVDVAAHSPQMDPLRLELVEALGELQPKASAVPIYSTVTGAIREGQGLDADYWGENLRKPVRFSETATGLLEDDHSVFIEMSPHPLLLRAIDENWEYQNKMIDASFAAVPSLVRDEEDLGTLLASAGRIYTLGCELRWESLHPRPKSLIKLPSYPWQRERYWFDEAHKEKRKFGNFKRTAGMTKIENLDQEAGKTPKEKVKSSKTKASRTLRESLTAAEPGKPRALILETYLKEQLAKILMLPASHLDPGKAFKAYGMDSLTALKFRSRIESATGLRLSATLVWNYPNILHLSKFLAEKMGMPPERPRAGGVSMKSEASVKQGPIGAGGETLGDLLEELESMSDEEARKLLNDDR